MKHKAVGFDNSIYLHLLLQVLFHFERHLLLHLVHLQIARRTHWHVPQLILRQSLPALWLNRSSWATWWSGDAVASRARGKQLALEV